MLMTQTRGKPYENIEKHLPTCTGITFQCLSTISCQEIMKLIQWWFVKCCEVSAMWDYIRVKIRINLVCKSCCRYLQGQAKIIDFIFKNSKEQDGCSVRRAGGSSLLGMSPILTGLISEYGPKSKLGIGKV